MSQRARSSRAPRRQARRHVAAADRGDEYTTPLERARLAGDAATRPQVFASTREFGIDLTIRYLVPAREMRRWASKLLLAVNRALAQPDVARKVCPPVPSMQMHTAPFPRRQVDPDSDDAGA